jgi:hypothetical protein
MASRAHRIINHFLAANPDAQLTTHDIIKLIYGDDANISDRNLQNATTRTLRRAKLPAGWTVVSDPNPSKPSKLIKLI